MADKIQITLEQMLDELKLLSDLKIFSEGEINEIVKQRKHFEYNIRSHQVVLGDYLRYIQYETTLEKLTKIRIKQKNFAPKKKKKIRKYSGLKTIHHLYQRALKKYFSNPDLWIQYINFSIHSGSNRVLNRTFSQAIKYHPLNIDIWLKAVHWEYEINHNMRSARALMQRALRLNKAEKKLWVGYLKLELMYRKKITERMELVGLDKQALVKSKEEGEKKEEKEEKEGGGGEGEEGGEIELEDNGKEDKEMKELTEKIEEIENKEKKETKREKGGFFEGKIASIIANEIIKLFPTDLELRIEMFKIYKQFQNTEKLQSELVESIRNDFPNDPNSKYFISSLPLFSFSIVDDSEEFNELLDQCVSSFNNDLNSIPESPMFSLFLTFYLDLLRRSNSQSTSEKIVKGIEEVHNKAKKIGVLDENMFVQLGKVFRATGILPKYFDIIENGLFHFPTSYELVHSLFDAILCSSAFSDNKLIRDTLVEYKNKLEKALNTLMNNWEDGEEGIPVWRLYLSYFTLLQPNSFPSVLDKFKKCLVSNLADIQVIKKETMEYTALSFGLQSARKIFEKCLEFPPNKIEIFRTMINIENSQFPVDNKFIDKLYNDAIHEPSSKNDPDIFIEYINFVVLSDKRDWKKINHIQYLAQNALKGDNLAYFQTRPSK